MQLYSISILELPRKYLSSYSHIHSKIYTASFILKGVKSHSALLSNNTDQCMTRGDNQDLN